MFLNYQSCLICHQGIKRSKNEDNFLAQFSFHRPLACRNTPAFIFTGNSHYPLCHMILDGMGGESDGDLASLAAARGFHQYSQAFWQDWPDQVTAQDLRVHQYVEAVSREVRSEARQRRSGVSGSTCSFFLLHKKSVIFCNVGDSPLWLFREGELQPMSVPHIRVVRPAREGFGPKGGLTQFMGIDIEDFLLSPEIRHQECQDGDVLIACSDGLSDMVPRQTIVEVLRTSKDAEKAVVSLLKAALQAGGRDNITISVTSLFSGAIPAARRLKLKYLAGEQVLAPALFSFPQLPPKPLPDLIPSHLVASSLDPLENEPTLPLL